MIEILLGILTLIGIATLFLLTQKKSDNSDIKFQSSLDEKVKLIHDQIGRNREEASKSSKDNREELSKTLNQFIFTFSRTWFSMPRSSSLNDHH